MMVVPVQALRDEGEANPCLREVLKGYNEHILCEVVKPTLPRNSP